MRVAYVFFAFLSIGAPAPAYAFACILNGPRYELTSDIVNWSMKIGSGQSCIRGLRLGNVTIERLELASSPRTGQLTIHGSGFVYSAKSEYEGEDFFSIALSGKTNRLRGNSTIRITVSVEKPDIGNNSRSRPPEPIAAPKPLVTSPVDNSLPLPDDESLRPCPTWGSSKGAPAPMQPAFNRSKLYCLESAIDPARFGLPTADTAGVPPGVTLANYNGPMTITTPGTVIENVIIDGTLSVKAVNVTIKNCIIQNFGWWGIEGEGAANLRIENCDIIGPGARAASNSAILGSGTFVGNDIRGVAIGIQTTDGASTIRDNYIHDLASGAADPHYDGITVLGRQNHVVIEHNTISAPSNNGTAEVFIDNDFGFVNDVIVRENLMFGDPAYAVHVGAKAGLSGTITNVVIENNYLERGYYGYIALENANATVRNNVQWDNRIDPIPYPKR